MAWICAPIPTSATSKFTPFASFHPRTSSTLIMCTSLWSAVKFSLKLQISFLSLEIWSIMSSAKLFGFRSSLIINIGLIITEFIQTLDPLLVPVLPSSYVWVFAQTTLQYSVSTLLIISFDYARIAFVCIFTAGPDPEYFSPIHMSLQLYRSVLWNQGCYYKGLLISVVAKHVLQSHTLTTGLVHHAHCLQSGGSNSPSQSQVWN